MYEIDWQQVSDWWNWMDFAVRLGLGVLVAPSVIEGVSRNLWRAARWTGVRRMVAAVWSGFHAWMTRPSKLEVALDHQWQRIEAMQHRDTVKLAGQIASLRDEWDEFKGPHSPKRS